MTANWCRRSAVKKNLKQRQLRLHFLIYPLSRWLWLQIIKVLAAGCWWPMLNLLKMIWNWTRLRRRLPSPGQYCVCNNKYCTFLALSLILFTNDLPPLFFPLVLATAGVLCKAHSLRDTNPVGHKTKISVKSMILLSKKCLFSTSNMRDTVTFFR